jgi:hypothetical protein
MLKRDSQSRWRYVDSLKIAFQRLGDDPVLTPMFHDGTSALYIRNRICEPLR